ncbi:MAG: alpha/beta fold hydrolase [Nesterenkonia sp.]
MDLKQTTVPQLTPTLLTGSPEDLSSGGRPVLVVGPSLGTSVSALWGPALAQLAEHFTVIGWDLPGHGRSSPSAAPFTMDQLAEAVESLVSAQFTAASWPAEHPVFFAGVSIGGAVSLALARREHAPFSAYALICSAANIGAPQAWLDRAALVAEAGTPTMVEGSAQRWFAEGFTAAHPETATALLDSLQHAERHSYAHACFALSRFDMREDLGSITDPLLAVAGDEDVVCPPAEAYFVAQNVAGARAEVLAGVAHLAPAEDPVSTARLLKEHFLG